MRGRGHGELSVHVRRASEFAALLPPGEDSEKVRRWMSISQEESSHQGPNLLPPDLGFPSLQTLRNNYLFFKPPRPRYFVIAAHSDSILTKDVFAIIRNGKAPISGP